MSGDLISRDKLLEDFRNTITEKSDTLDWLNMIARQPVAYDVDKVVEQLEILSDNADDKIMEREGLEHYWDGFGDGIDEAIKVVKGGGLNG